MKADVMNLLLPNWMHDPKDFLQVPQEEGQAAVLAVLIVPVIIDSRDSSS